MMISQFAYINYIHFDLYKNAPSLTLIGNITYNRFDMKECSWSHSDDVRKYKENSKRALRKRPRSIMGIDILLKQTNLTFVLKAGSLLGAYRNGGVIPGDADLDIIIPIWMNLNAFNIPDINYQNCMMANQMLSQTLGISPTAEDTINNTKLCGLDIDDWVNIVFDYFNSTFGEYSAPFILNDSKVIGFKWIPYDAIRHKKGRRHDVWIAINYEKWVSAYSNICLCKFDSMMVWCFEDSNIALEEHYGPEYMTPMVRSNGTWVTRQQRAEQKLELLKRESNTNRFNDDKFNDVNYTIKYFQKRFESLKFK